MSENLQAVRKIILYTLHTDRHVTSQREEPLRLVASAGTLAHDNFVDRLHRLVLVTVYWNSTCRDSLDHLLGERPDVSFQKGVLAEDSRIAKVGIVSAQDDSQGSNVEWSDLFRQDLGKCYPQEPMSQLLHQA